MFTDWLLQVGRERPAHADYLHLQQLSLTYYGKHQTGALLGSGQFPVRAVVSMGRCNTICYKSVL